MRTTVTLTDDVAAAVEGLRRSEGLGVSEALNRLARRGLAAPAASRPYVNKSYDIGLKIDITNIGEVLGWLDELEARERGDEYHPNA